MYVRSVSPLDPPRPNNHRYDREYDLQRRDHRPRPTTTSTPTVAGKHRNSVTVSTSPYGYTVTPLHLPTRVPPSPPCHSTRECTYSRLLHSRRTYVRDRFATPPVPIHIRWFYYTPPTTHPFDTHSTTYSHPRSDDLERVPVHMRRQLPRYYSRGPFVGPTHRLQRDGYLHRSYLEDLSSKLSPTSLTRQE